MASDTREAEEKEGGSSQSANKGDEKRMATKDKCRFCGQSGQGVCYECAIDSMEWHNNRIPLAQAQKAGTELIRRMKENV